MWTYGLKSLFSDTITFYMKLKYKLYIKFALNFFIYINAGKWSLKIYVKKLIYQQQLELIRVQITEHIMKSTLNKSYFN
jgi:hypothetical protein